MRIMSAVIWGDIMLDLTRVPDSGRIKPCGPVGRGIPLSANHNAATLKPSCRVRGGR